MIDLHEALDDMGAKVVHIKTDSIKVVDPSPEIEQFILNFAHEYGYNFKVEDRFDRFCLINESTYVAMDTEGEWHTTGTEFLVPYVRKTLFTKEPIDFADICELKSSKTALYLDLNENQGFLAQLAKEGGYHEVKEEILKDGSVLYHNYHFIGKTGRFIPVLPGHNGGALVRKDEDLDKFAAVANTKKKEFEKGLEEPFYRFLEAETIDEKEAFEICDFSYWESKTDEAKKKLEKFGSYDYFVSADLGHFMDFIDE